MISVLTPSIRPSFLWITQECLEKQTFQDFEWLVEIGLRNNGFTLPSDMNRMLKRAKGSRIVILQDCIHVDNDFLERVNALPNEMYTFPVGQVNAFGDTPEWDWRDNHPGQVPGATYWETDLACAPRMMFYEIGGYDERYNEGWSWDNVDIGYRAYAAGHLAFCDNTIRGISIRHDKLVEHPFRGKKESNSKRAEETKYRADRKDYRLNYLHDALN